MGTTLLLVAFNLGTIIVLILALVFFGGILFLASHTRKEPSENQPPAEVSVPSNVAPMGSSRKKHGQAASFK